MGLKREINNHTTLVGDLSTSLSTMDRSSGPKKSKRKHQTWPLEQVDLTDMHRVPHATSAEHILPTSHRMFSRRGYVLVTKRVWAKSESLKSYPKSKLGSLKSSPATGVCDDSSIAEGKLEKSRVCGNDHTWTTGVMQENTGRPFLWQGFKTQQENEIAWCPNSTSRNLTYETETI